MGGIGSRNGFPVRSGRVWSVPTSALGLRTGLSTGLFVSPMTLILASTSAIRRALLEQAGVTFAVERPDVDEASIEVAHAGEDFELA